MTTEQILTLCQSILALFPNQNVGKERLYSLLDDSIINLDATAVTTIIDRLRALGIHEELLLDRDAYEYAREVALAEAIIAVGDQSPLQNFRSAQWYHDAHHFENAALAQYAPNNILMVGSGPFPSTALSLLQSFPNANIHCLEKRRQACNLSQEVAEILGHGNLYIHWGNALSRTTLEMYDCIIVGTVVGVLTDEKNTIIDYFLALSNPGTTLAFRTATGPGKIIYPTVDLSLFDGSKFQILDNPPQKTWTTIIVKSG